MAHPLYFLPNLRQAQCESVPLMASVLKERGLKDVFADVPHAHICINELPGRGPDNKSGTIITYQIGEGEVPRRLGYYPNEQKWTPVGDGSLLWLGIDTAEPPTPDDMRRRKQYHGYLPELGDGNKWVVPIIRRPDGTTELPTGMVYDAAGRYSEPLKPAYQAYWDETGEVAAWYFGGMETEFPRQRALDLAIRALSLNYRFGRNEQNVLQVIDTECYLTVLACTIDAPRIESDPLKKTPAGLNTPSTTSGLPDGSPATAPAEQTSI